jgi:hypothetical protein
MSDILVTDYLEHTGVLGMHWGRHLPGRTEESHNDEHVKAHVLAKKPIHSLSNNELQTVNQRLQLEQQYKKLKSNTGAQAKIKKGNDAVKTALAVGASVGGTYILVTKTTKFIASPEGQKAIAIGAKALGKLIGKW